MAPTLAKKITVDVASKKLFIDGVEFPWLIAALPTIRVTGIGEVPTVILGLLADDVEVIPEHPAS